MKKIFPIVAIITFFVFAIDACSKKEQPSPDSEVIITSIYPFNVKGGDTITIKGKNLSNDIAHTSILLNGKSAAIISSTPDSIQAKTPLKAGSGVVEVNINNKSYVGPEYTYDYKVTVTTIAGNGNVGASDGPGLQSSFNCPWGITANAAGDLFVADCYNRLIRKISGQNYTVSTYTIPTLINGKNFYSPYNIAVDTTTQNVYVTDFNKNMMKMDASGNMDVIYIDSMPLTGIVVNPSATNLYISNNTKGTIVKMDMNGKNASVFATGLITPRNIFFNRKGKMFVTAYPGPIYEIGNTGSYASVANNVSFGGWEAVADTSGNFFLADHLNNRLTIIEKSGKSKTIAGSGTPADIDGIGLNASFDGPQGIAIDTKGNLYITTYNYNKASGNKVRKVVIE